MSLPTAVLVAIPQTHQELRRSLREHFRVVETDHHQHSIHAHDRACAVILGCTPETSTEAIEAAGRIRFINSSIVIVLVTEFSSEALAIAALRAGVSDYYAVPFSADALVASVGERINRAEPRPRTRPAAAVSMIGASPAIQAIRVYVEKVASTDANVLVTGETGTGKELVAQLIHARSPRRGGPFVTVNCAAIPDSLIESELFGHERGAFTGATTSRDGYFRAADDGTLLLDEIGEMSAFAQAKLLRTLDTREVSRLGSTKRLPLNVRVVAATNQDLGSLMQQGRFRRDLFYRLNVASVRIPPLRERREDVAPLLMHYIGELNLRWRRVVEGFTVTSLRQLEAYDWPGNVREVKNLVESAFAELPDRSVRWLEAPPALQASVGRLGAVSHGERDRLVDALKATNWNKSLAAERLQWSRMTLYRKIAKYHVEP